MFFLAAHRDIVRFHKLFNALILFTQIVIARSLKFFWRYTFEDFRMLFAEGEQKGRIRNHFLTFWIEFLANCFEQSFPTFLSNTDMHS